MKLKVGSAARAGVGQRWRGFPATQKPPSMQQSNDRTNDGESAASEMSKHMHFNE
jgi:hypothetical protein